MDSQLKKLVAEIKHRFDQEIVPELHPDDQATYKQGWAEGQDHAPGFCEERLDWFIQMIAVYPDQEAHVLLDELRASFWTGAYKEE